MTIKTVLVAAGAAARGGAVDLACRLARRFAPTEGYRVRLCA